jgi:MFS family permease
MERTKIRRGDTTASKPHSGRTAKLWDRQLQHYPETGRRFVYLGIVVLATIVLYYELYVQGSVAPSILQQYHMSFKYFVYISVVGNAVGAFTSLIAGLADRWGRANLVVYGLLVTGLLTLFGLPNAGDKLSYALLFTAVSFVEGIILVATPALVRDFSPQVGRAAAMGFWALGPVVGSLAVTEVSSNTLGHLHAWQDQFIICGTVGLVVFVIALFGLRELAPNIRDQLMVNMTDRVLIEARAQGLDIEESLRHPWRQMLHLDIVGSAFAVSVLLLIYYTAVGFFVVYFTTVFGFSEKQANGIGNWFWSSEAVALIVVGALSDKLRVRKPFMVIGALGAAIMTIVFLTRTSHPNTSYYTFVVIITLLAICISIAYAPWMASFTETVEKHNPALTATGLAIWGWTLRAVVSLSLFILPILVSSTTVLVSDGAQVQATAKAVAPELAIVQAHPALFAELQKYPTDAIPPALLQQAVAQVGLPSLLAVNKVAPQLQYLLAHAPKVQAAAKSSPNQWRHWWWVCVGGELVFLPLILLMAGRWSPKKARLDEEQHERTVEEELAKLSRESATSSRSTVGAAGHPSG